MAAEPVLTIRKSFPRPDPEHVKALAGFPTGYFVDIQGRRGAMDLGIRPMFGAPSVIGTAVTVKTVPDDNLAPYAALDVLQPGDILVIACGGWTGSAVIGDLIVGMFKNAGTVAVVTDGAVRDVVGLEQVGLPIFARGLTPNSPQKNGPGAVGVDITIGGVTVGAGDLIVADRDGVVVLPRGQVADAVAAVRAIKDKESKIEAAIAKGQTAPDWVKDLLAGDATRYID
jgi:4-hydroxy-4-methyl-2-oxoglutarate aldolase